MEGKTYKDIENVNDIQVQHLIKDNWVAHVVSEKDNIKTILETLYKHHIHSAPVVDEKSNCKGWIDILDLLNFLIKVIHEDKESSTTPVSNSIKDDDLEMLLERSKSWSLASSSKVLSGKSLNDSVNASFLFLPITKGAPVSAAFQNFAKGVSRIPVVDNQNQKLVIGVLTQTDIVKLLADKEQILGDLNNKKASELAQGANKIASVEEDTLAVDAFTKIAESDLNNVAIVNKHGALVGCLSATDLKLIGEYNFKLLLLPVKDFLTKVREGQDRAKRFLVYVNGDDTLKDIVKKLRDEGVHRVFVVGEHMKPVGVVSVTDIAKHLETKYKW